MFCLLMGWFSSSNRFWKTRNRGQSVTVCGLFLINADSVLTQSRALKKCLSALSQAVFWKPFRNPWLSVDYFWEALKMCFSLIHSKTLKNDFKHGTTPDYFCENLKCVLLRSKKLFETPDCPRTVRGRSGVLSFAEPGLPKNFSHNDAWKIASTQTYLIRR